jgi:hypothetical protein
MLPIPDRVFYFGKLYVAFQQTHERDLQGMVLTLARSVNCLGTWGDHFRSSMTMEEG